jgi:hypothetical protein
VSATRHMNPYRWAPEKAKANETEQKGKDRNANSK